jgi:hypothetical protein
MTPRWRPTHTDPLFILAMDHRGSFGTSLFGVGQDGPTADQEARMRAAKDLTYAGLRQAVSSLGRGRAGVLVDEQYGREVIDAASGGPVVLAVPVEESGQDWFTLQWGEQWTEHVAAIAPDYAKVLVRDNPSFDAGERHAQLDRLAAVSSQLTEMGVPFLYELLVPATDAQKRAGAEAYDRDVRPDLVAQVLGDNHAAGVGAGGGGGDHGWPGRGPDRAGSGCSSRAVGPLAGGGSAGGAVRRIRDRSQHLGGGHPRSRGRPGGRPGGTGAYRRALPRLRPPLVGRSRAGPDGQPAACVKTGR